MTPGTELGIVVGGSLTKTVEVRLNPGAAAPLGHYLMLPVGEGAQLLGMVTDVVLRAAESGPTSWPPPSGDDPAAGLLRDILLDTGVYTAVDVTPYLEVTPSDVEKTARARRLPQHFATVFPADQEAMNVALQAGEASIDLGAPLGMDELTVRVDIERLFERSAGIFGKSGTGKTILGLTLLSSLLDYSEAAPTASGRTVALVFDMHDDYGYAAKFEGEHRSIPSLRSIHGSDVLLVSLGGEHPNADASLTIGTQDITYEDIQLLQTTANFTGPAVEAAYQIQNRMGSGWIDLLLEDDPPGEVESRLWREGPPDEPITWNRVADRLGVHPGSFQNLRRGLQRLTRHKFIRSGDSQIGNALRNIVATLQGGKSVIVQFGHYGNDLASYMLVANMLSRRIWDAYREATERAEAEVNRLVIVIEEAHKFMDPAVSNLSIFGQIARELRKYNVTLLVIDQRPSQIDREVLSQIGTKACFQLDNDQDVDALIGGVAGRSGLRQVLATLESQRQALVFGHALPMPVVVRPPEMRPGVRPSGTLRERLAASIAGSGRGGETDPPSIGGRRRATSGGLYGG